MNWLHSLLGFQFGFSSSLRLFSHNLLFETSEALFFLFLDLLFEPIYVAIEDFIINKFRAPTLLIQLEANVTQPLHRGDKSLILDMISHRLLLLSFNGFLAFVLLAADHFEIVVANNLLLFFKTICEHIEPVEAYFDVMSDLHDRA